MKKFALAATVASGLAAAVIGLAAPATAAPAGPGDAQQTIDILRAQGYTVIVTASVPRRWITQTWWQSGQGRATRAQIPVFPVQATTSPRR